MLLCHTKDDEEREEAVLRLLEETQVDGVLVCSARLPDDDLLALLNKQRAVVMLNRQIPNLDAGILHVEDVSGAIQAVNHLIDSGRKRIGHIAGPAHTWSAQARRQGFIQANEQAGLSRNVNLIASCKPNSASGQEATLKLLTTYPDIDSLFCYNDLVAIGALQACQQLGKRIPEDIALVGSDDIPLASLISPALTTLHVDKAELGALLLRLLIERVEGQVEQEEILIQQELIIRDSAP
jgi:LacI family transcriptional regulator